MAVTKSISSLAEQLQLLGGEEQGSKLLELGHKLNHGDFFITFCGHFSAGKSTLVNRLCGHKLLPSSPIPTSANVVRIRNGDPEARITRRLIGTEGTSVESIPLEQLEEACKDGEGIETVEIRYPVGLLGDHTVLLDTPGIDSTDDAHQAATQSAMHMADIVFYVMDYNYVQSEINFTFAKKLKDAGKPLYLIINQIDKHREEELSFTHYQEGVKEAFRNWHIEPEGILFLSLKDPNHPYNDWLKLPELIKQLSIRSVALKEWNVGQTAVHFVDQVMRGYREQRELEKVLYREAVGSMEEVEGWKQEDLRLANEGLALNSQIQAAAGRWKSELQSIIDNANLTPADTRDLAAAYLESCKPSFRVGFFGRAAKTEEERSRRLELFRRNVEERRKVHLNWHAADYIKKEWKALSASEAELEEVDQIFNQELAGEWLSRLVQTGPDVTGEYVLNYCKLLAGELKQQCRQLTLPLLDRLLERLEERSATRRFELEESRKELALKLAAYQGLERMEQEEAELERKLLQLAHELDPVPNGKPDLPNPEAINLAELRQGEPSLEGVAHPTRPGTETAKSPVVQESAAAILDDIYASTEEELQDQPSTSLPDQLKETSRRLELAAEVLEELTGTERWRNSLRERSQKLKENRFTLALFGAFSAGKSSFANALMGERVLPVSPNPTTAAINTILPPTDEYPNGTVRVLLKTVTEILEEMAYSLRAIGLDLAQEELQAPDKLLQRIRKLVPADASANGKPHVTFLKAVEKGWPDLAHQLGGQILTGREEFQAFVAQESKACFARLVELYQHTPLSQHGVVLVDTPGADSINARHTGVAFNYIKNADAILFVTYYNHAFSQADREFLLQLGRVKDTMQLDKMFFIVNAADLASSQEELAGVLKHVESNLLRFGIRNPRLFPVSSQLAVQSKLTGDKVGLVQSGISAFERAFQQFAEQELAALAVGNAYSELYRAASQLDSWISAAQQESGARTRKLEELAAAESQALELCRFHYSSNDKAVFRKELEEQLYYVKQRCFFRFSEFYRLAFNPSALREDRGQDLRMAFKAAWQELLRLLGYQLSQEVLAVTLRLEVFVNDQAEEHWNRINQSLEQLLENWSRSAYEYSSLETPEVDERPSAEDPDVKWLLGFYRNGRQFFEGEGQNKLMAALESRLTGPVEAYLLKQQERLGAAYEQQAAALTARLSEQEQASVTSHCSGLRAALSLSHDLEGLLSKRKRLEELLPVADQ